MGPQRKQFMFLTAEPFLQPQLFSIAPGRDAFLSPMSCACESEF